MTALFQQIADQVRQQVAAIRPFVGYAGAMSSGRIKLRRVTEATADDELYGMLLPFAPSVDDEAIWVDVGGKPYCLGLNGRTAGPMLYRGAGSPEGSVTAAIGSIYLRTNGSTDTAVYRKESGSGNTGWVAITNATANEWQRGMVTKSLIASTTSTTPFQLGLSGYTGTANVFDDQMDANSAGAWLLHNTDGVTNAEGGWDLSDVIRTNWYPAWLTYRVQTGGTITNLRIWVGAFSATPMASDDPALHGVGFRYSTTSGSVNWWAWSNDGSGSGTGTNTGVTPSSHTAYTLAIEIVSTASVRFYIDGTLVATHTTNLPGATTSLLPRCMARTLGAAVRSIRWSWFHVQHT